MDWTLKKFKDFLMDTEDFDTLSLDFIEDILGEEEAQDLINDYNIELNEDDEIIWSEFTSQDNFEELCQDDDFISLITAYFDLDEIVFIHD